MGLQSSAMFCNVGWGGLGLIGSFSDRPAGSGRFCQVGRFLGLGSCHSCGVHSIILVYPRFRLRLHRGLLSGRPFGA